MQRTAISVIIPAYQVGPYFRQCLDSLLNQDFELPYQVILVESDSKDETAAICQEYERKYPGLFYYYHYDRNDGVSVGRNLGLLHSVGEYIAFMDGDDFVDRRYLNQLYQCAKAKKAQVVTCGYSIYTTKAKKGYSRLKFNGTGKEALLYLYHSPKMKMRTFCWGRLIERKLLTENRIMFDSDAERFEDWIFMSEALFHADRVCYFPYPLYFYRQNENSLMGRANDYLTPHLYAVRTVRDYLFRKDASFEAELYDKPRFAIRAQFSYDASKSYKALNMSEKQAKRFAKEELKKIFNGRKTK